MQTLSRRDENCGEGIIRFKSPKWDHAIVAANHLKRRDFLTRLELILHEKGKTTQRACTDVLGTSTVHPYLSIGGLPVSVFAHVIRISFSKACEGEAWDVHPHASPATVTTNLSQHRSIELIPDEFLVPIF